METNHEDTWVAGRLAAIEPQWHADPLQARAMFDIKLKARRHSWIGVSAAATAALCLAALAFPETRATAQGLWYRLVLNRVDIVRLDLSDLPLHAHVTSNGLEERVQDAVQAEQKAGFKPYLPSLGGLYTNPNMTVTGPIAVEQTIHIRDLQSALAKVGARDVHAPAEWEGVTLRAAIGPMVTLNYPDDSQVLQARPIELYVPPGFALERFLEVAFRSIGVPWWEARAMGKKFAADPALLLDIPTDEVVNIQEVRLRAGPALLFEDFDDKGALERVTVIRSTHERIYSVSSSTRERSMMIADALP